MIAMTNKSDTTNATPTNNNRKIENYSSKKRKGSANSNNNNNRLSDIIQENGHSTPNFDESIEKTNIRLLDEPEQRKYGEYHYYCLHCEYHLRNFRHVKEHIIASEHRAKQQRQKDRIKLKEYLAKFKDNDGHILALDLLCLSVYDNNGENHHLNELHQRNVQRILVGVQKTFEEAFKQYLDGEGTEQTAVEVVLTGSMLTGLYAVKNDTCGLDIFVKFHKHLNDQMSLGTRFMLTEKALEKVSLHFPDSYPGQVHIHKLNAHYCPSLLRFNLIFNRFCYSITLGMGDMAERMHLSTRLVLSYLQIWPKLSVLVRFVRRWIEAILLNFQARGSVSNFAFDILCIFYLQRTGYLPILDQFIGELNADDDDKKEEKAENVLSVRNIDELCRLPEHDFIQTCHRIRHLYYGQQSPTLSPGQMIYGFFKYFATEFSFHDQCSINSVEIIEKPLRGEKHYSILDPFLKMNMLKLRHEGDAYLWNCFFKTAVYLCIPNTNNGPLFNVKLLLNEFETNGHGPMNKSKIAYLRISSDSAMDRVKDQMKSGKVKYEYIFDPANFKERRDQLPSIVCQHCSAHLHCSSDCNLVRPSPIYELIGPIRPNLNEQLSNIISEHYTNTRLTKDRQRMIRRYIHELESIMREELETNDLRLTSFGSAVNGFGTMKSDLDLCLQSQKIIQSEELIRKISQKMLKEGYKVECILTAKVPIVKFDHPVNGFKGDISIGNCLGIKNSEMLRVYCKLDSRVAPLGLFIKHLFKQHGLNESPNGSFSSYSLILLLIAFLQRGCHPPVLPYLQEMAKEIKPRDTLEGWDVTFSRCTAEQYQKQRKEPANKETMAQLFVGFLHYYVSKFDPHMEVVQIRQSAPLKKIDKNGSSRSWDQYTFCIEDPFDLDHNTTAGIKIEMLGRFLHTLAGTLKELALLDTKLSWPIDSKKQQKPLHSLLNLVQNCDVTNDLSFLPRLLSFS